MTAATPPLTTTGGTMPEIHEPVIVTDGGPWAEHDQACPVCRMNKAVLDFHYGIFQPCWQCQKIGWMTRCLPGVMGKLATRYGYRDGCDRGAHIDGRISSESEGGLADA